MKAQDLSSAAFKIKKMRFKCLILNNIYILNEAAFDETIIPSCLHFSMQNIEQSGGVGRASRSSSDNINQ